MKRALELAWSVKGYTSPNPSVGAVIVKNGTIIGEGSTSPPGGNHAEINALNQAGNEAMNGEMYVTMEPCSTQGRTPPCTDAIIESGIKRVVAAVKDSNPKENGLGLESLSEAGIQAEYGLMEREAAGINEDFFHWIKTGKPWVNLKLAMTLDCRIADTAGNSKWITNSESRRYVHLLRSRHDMVCTGAGTVQKDNPSLNVRHIKRRNPIRGVFTYSSGPVQGYDMVINKQGIRTVVITSEDHPKGKETRGAAEYWYTGPGNSMEFIERFLEMAGDEDITSVMIEGGQNISSLFLEHNFVNRVYLFYGSKILGSGLNGIELKNKRGISESSVLKSPEHKSFGSDFMITGTL